MKAVGYVRVSTEEQAKHGISLDAQRGKIQAYAALEDMELIGIEADEGISGCSIKGRPAIQRVLQMVRTRQVETVVIYKLDRLARNTVEALDIARLLDKKGVALHSITERLDTHSALGKFFFTLMASLAEMERGLISERIVAAMETKRLRNEALNNNPEFGFRIVERKVVPDLQEQKTIQRVCTLHRGGHTIYSIISILTQEGFVNRKDKPFGKTQIHAIIQRKAA